MMRTILFFTYLWLSLAASFPLAVLVLVLRLVGLGRLAARPVQAFARLWASSVLAVIGVRLSAEGLERIPRNAGVCFVGNHQGDLDTIIALALIDRPFGFTAKKEAMFFPFLGLWVALLGGVFIDRKSARKAAAAIRKGAASIGSGRSMIIFPEGTRSRGPRMLDFRPGAFKLATLSDAPIVPVTIDGSYAVWEAENRIRPGSVRVVFHEPVPTAGLGPEERRALSARVRGIIASALPAQRS
jgi:1-acyl-sn-glycerol-3-phosphate acyltransferase